MSKIILVAVYITAGIAFGYALDDWDRKCHGAHHGNYLSIIMAAAFGVPLGVAVLFADITRQDQTIVCETGYVP